MSDFFSFIPDGQYYRFHHMFYFTIQRLVFALAMEEYLDSEKMITREEAAKGLGIKVRKKR